jgi:hypothetical protein
MYDHIILLMAPGISIKNREILRLELYSWLSLLVVQHTCSLSHSDREKCPLSSTPVSFFPTWYFLPDFLDKEAL